MNITKATIQKLKLDYAFMFYDNCDVIVDSKLATRINILWELDKGKLSKHIGKTLIAPTKKEVTYEWVMQKLNTANVFVNFCKTFNAFLDLKGLRGYATSYGIGVESLFSGHAKLEENQNLIECELNTLGIQYTTEYSNAKWVFRYKISQSKENIEMLIKAINGRHANNKGNQS